MPRETRDRGFGLTEAILAMGVVSALVGTIASFMVVGLRTMDAGAERISDSKDTQLLSAYLASDVQTNAQITAGSCGAAAGETRLVGFEKADASVVVYYASHASTGGEVVRRTCATAGGAVTSRNVLIRNLGGADPTVTCDGATCSAGSKPDKVLMGATTDGGFTFTLAGSRRTFTDPYVAATTTTIESYPAWGRTLTLFGTGIDVLETASTTALTINGDVLMKSSSANWCKCVPGITMPDDGGVFQEPQLTDPLASLPYPDVTGLPVYTDGLYHGPGVYRSKLLKIDNTQVMAPGTYIVEYGMAISGSLANVSGSGVFIFLGCGLNAPLTCSSSRGFLQNGGAKVDLSAPTSGTYKDILIFQHRSNTDALDITAGGAATNDYEGVLYASAATMTNLGVGTGSTLRVVSIVTKMIKVGVGTFLLGPFT